MMPDVYWLVNAATSFVAGAALGSIVSLLWGIRGDTMAVKHTLERIERRLSPSWDDYMRGEGHDLLTHEWEVDQSKGRHE